MSPDTISRYSPLPGDVSLTTLHHPLQLASGASYFQALPGSDIANVHLLICTGLGRVRGDKACGAASCACGVHVRVRRSSLIKYQAHRCVKVCVCKARPVGMVVGAVSGCSARDRRQSKQALYCRPGVLHCIRAVVAQLYYRRIAIPDFCCLL